jgi:hypothetical protein
MELNFELNQSGGSANGSFSIDKDAPYAVRQAMLVVLAHQLGLADATAPEPADTRITSSDPVAQATLNEGITLVQKLSKKLTQIRALVYRSRERKEWEAKNTPRTLDGQPRVLGQFAKWLGLSQSELIIWATKNGLSGSNEYTMLDYNKQLQIVDHFNSDRYINEMIDMFDK